MVVEVMDGVVDMVVGVVGTVVGAVVDVVVGAVVDAVEDGLPKTMLLILTQNLRIKQELKRYPEWVLINYYYNK
jgi:hypothetical protein